MKLDRATGKCIYSAPCGMSGCIDYNINIDEAFAAYNKASGGQFDGDTADEVAVFRFGDGKVFSIGCECEIRGGGGLISPLHIHHCELHRAKSAPRGWKSVEGGAQSADMEAFTKMIDGFHAIADALRQAGYKVDVEGGGAACTFLSINLPDGRVLHLGDINDTWCFDVYPDQKAVEEGENGEGQDLGVPREITEPATIVAAFQAALGKMNQVEAVAKEFSIVLREWLQPWEMEAVLKSNRESGLEQDSVCASHDHCDANMAMAEAFRRLSLQTGIDEGLTDAEKQAATDLWNAAWSMAKRREFAVTA